MKKNCKIGIIGCGGIAGAHIKGYAENRDVELIAFCDIKEENAKRYAEKLGGRTYSNYKMILEKEELDGISVCTPPVNHKEITEDVLSEGVNVFCEKPLAMNSREALSMAETAQKNKRLLMTGFKFRFKDEVQNENVFAKETAHFVNCILKKEKPIVDGLDGLRAQEVIDAAYKSCRENCRVEVKKAEI